MAEQFDLHPTQITESKTRLQERAAGVFGEEKPEGETVKVDVTRMQAKVLSISRSSFYYRRSSVPESDLKLMRAIDELHMDYPFAGSRMLLDLLAQRGAVVGRRHVRTLMQRLAIEAVCHKLNTSKPTPGRKICPYLLRGLAITRPDQVWTMDISCIPMARRFVYLAAVIDWFSRKVLSWKLSITMGVSFCLEALEEALDK